METILLSEEKPLGAGDLKRLRHHAGKVFERLERKIQNECSDGSLPPPSWVEGDTDNNNNININIDSERNTNHNKSPDHPTEASFRKRYFDDYGFWVARGFCDSHQASSMKQAMEDSVRKHWFPDGTRGEKAEEPTKQKQKVTSFGTDAKSNEARGDPFLESADKVSYFAEPTALDPESGSLKPEFCAEDQKMFALCKAGHGLHLPLSFRRVGDAGEIGIERESELESESEIDEKKTNGTENDNDNANHNTNTNTNTNSSKNSSDKPNVHEPFFEYTSSSKLRDLVLSLGYKDPVVPQSMYIFKNPIVGGAVHSHQDSTFLYSTPRQTCLGLWLALDDATLQNGCLWIRPKSHLEPLRRQFLRNPKHHPNAIESESANENEPKLTFKTHSENPEVLWEGSLPESVEVGVEQECAHDKHESDGNIKHEEPEISSMNFVPVEVKAGDLVLFCGTLDHFSLPNFSEEQRHTFQLHLVEGPRVGIQWSPANWLQYESEEAKGKGFLRLLDYVNER